MLLHVISLFDFISFFCQKYVLLINDYMKLCLSNFTIGQLQYILAYHWLFVLYDVIFYWTLCTVSNFRLFVGLLFFCVRA